MPNQQRSLFTVIMEYRGGTYIEQVSADDPESALKQWARQIKPITIAHLGEAGKAQLIRAIDEDLNSGNALAAITDTRNVWCHSALLGGSPILINLVATSKEATSSRCYE